MSEKKEVAIIKQQELPTIAELFVDNIAEAWKHEQLNAILNHEPKKEWIKIHPHIANWKYIPIERIEFLLRKIFKYYEIEITGKGTAFNGVFVTVRVHYLNPVTGKMSYHDGIGAYQLQTKKGSSPTDMANINNGAISMAFPMAKTLAVKDACDHFGKLFGADINRKDIIAFRLDESLNPDAIEHKWNDLNELYISVQKQMTPYKQRMAERIIEFKENASYKTLEKELMELKNKNV